MYVSLIHVEPLRIELQRPKVVLGAPLLPLFLATAAVSEQGLSVVVVVADHVVQEVSRVGWRERA